MGIFKDMLARAMKQVNNMDEKLTDAFIMRLDHKRRFEGMEGEPVLWQTFQNSAMKQPQLVVISRAYDYFVLVEKVCYSVDGTTSIIRYGVTYNALFSGEDTITKLEFLP